MRPFAQPARLLLALLLVAAWNRASLAQSSADGAVLATGENQFAFDLYAKLASEPGNLFFSPYSISSALAMTYAGARGQTAAEMAKTLHFSLPPQRLHRAMADLMAALNNGGVIAGTENYKLAVANAIWAQQGLHYNADFLALLRDDYQAELRQADFTKAAEPTRLEINQWVAGKTNDKIKDLIDPGALDAMARLVLVNAIYFKAAWESVFPQQATKEEAFHAAAGDANVAMMHHHLTASAMESADLQMLELPYQGGDLSMLILLPRRTDGLAELEGKLTPDSLSDWTRQMTVHWVDAAVPRFKLENKFEVSGVLSALGMHDAFNPSRADFTGMAAEAAALQFYISKVIHQAYVATDEKGTEAAAATAVIMRAGSARAIAPPPPMVFRADHPFVFLIRDNGSGAILFMGRVMKP